MCQAVTCRDTGSTSFEIRSCDGPREMYDAAWGRHCHSGSVWIDATHAIARRRAASFIGMPTQSPSSVLPVLSSSRTGVHSPERSMPVATVLTASSAGYCCARIDTPTSATLTSSASLIAASRLRRATRPFAIHLEGILDPELEESRIAGGENLTERRAAQRQVGRAARLRLPRLQPLEPVHRVERLGANFDRLRVRQMEHPQQRQVEVLAADSLDAVPRHRAEGP